LFWTKHRCCGCCHSRTSVEVVKGGNTRKEEMKKNEETIMKKQVKK
jgi:hypothetical protein